MKKQKEKRKKVGLMLFIKMHDGRTQEAIQQKDYSS